MYKLLMYQIVLILMVLSIGLVGCQLSQPTSQTTVKTQTQPTAITKQAPIISQPQPMSWMLGENLFTTDGDASLAVHLVELDNKQSVIIYSVAAPQMQSNEVKASLIESGKNTFVAKEPNLLAQFGDVQFIASSFEPAEFKGSELQLSVESPKLDKELDIQVMKGLEGVTPGQALEESDGGAFARTAAIEQGGYRITFNGFSLNTDDLQSDQQNAKLRTQQEDVLAAADSENSNSAEPISTPQAVQPAKTLMELSSGKPVRADATLRIENLSTKEVNFLYIVILNDGEVKAKVIE